MLTNDLLISFRLEIDIAVSKGHISENGSLPVSLLVCLCYLGVATSAGVANLPSLPETAPVLALGNPSPERERSQFLHCAIRWGKGAKALWQTSKTEAESNPLFSFKWPWRKLSAFWLPFLPPEADVDNLDYRFTERNHPLLPSSKWRKLSGQFRCLVTTSFLVLPGD